MKRQLLKTRSLPSPGFTLIELLVVMGLIVLLVTMTVGVVSGVIAGAREKGTKATLRKIDGLLSTRMEAFTMWCQANKLDGADLGKVIKRKNNFKIGFPQNLVEAGLGKAADEGETSSSEALYEFLTNGETYGADPVDKDAFDTSEVGDTDADDRPEFIDAWGRPLRFYRWPTRLIRPAADPTDHQTITMGTYGIATVTSPDNDPYFGSANAGCTPSIFFASMPATASELAKDPDDQLGWISISKNYFNTNDIEEFEEKYHTPETWSLPLIVSAGADGILGLHEPTDTDNHGHLAQPKEAEITGIVDNLSNRNLQP